jgi:hypothetical protein
VQMSLRLLRAEIWRNVGQDGILSNHLHRVTARRVPNQVLDTPAVIAHARLVVTGSDSHRLHEEIITAGGALREGHFRRLGVRETQTALDAALLTEPGESVKRRLADLWPQMSGPLMQSLEVRMKDRTEGVRSLLFERQHREKTDIQYVLRELEKAIRRELDEPEAVQLELFSSDERDQLRANMDALRLRLVQIPGEIEREFAAIEARYADPQPRLFPVAVTFLVPDRLAI